MLTIWGRANSLNVQKVLWTAAELGIDFKCIAAGREFGITTRASYLAMNPNGLIPVIDDDGFLLWESNTIVRYLVAKYGARTTLWPSNLHERALAERWMDWQVSALDSPVKLAFVSLVRLPPKERNLAAIERVGKHIDDLLRVLDGQLAGRSYVNGRDFTMGDVPIGATVNRWYRLPLKRELHFNVERWLETLRARPAFQAHVDLPLS